MFEITREKIAGLICPRLIEQRDQALRLADIDALTGLANRRAFDRAISDLDPQTSVILFDVNNFGQANKQKGHALGDELLRSIAEVIRLHSARAFRYAGDEFVCLASTNAASGIRDAIEQAFPPYTLDGCEVTLTGTVGPSLEIADLTLQARKLARKQTR